MPEVKESQLTILYSSLGKTVALMPNNLFGLAMGTNVV